MGNTGTPWRKCVGTGATEIRGEASGGKSNPRVCRVLRDDLNSDENAEFIVTACNSHDQLVAALKQAQARLVFANKHIDCQDDIDAAEAALAAAGIK